MAGIKKSPCADFCRTALRCGGTPRYARFTSTDPRLAFPAVGRVRSSSSGHTCRHLHLRWLSTELQNLLFLQKVIDGEVLRRESEPSERSSIIAIC